MGLGLIALGFLFLEGLQLTFSSIELQPHYVALSFILMGLFYIRKRTTVKYLNLTLFIGLLLFIDYFLIPDITTNQITYFLSQLITLGLKYVFYILLCLTLHQLLHNEKLKKYMMYFIICHTILDIDLIFVFIKDVTLFHSFSYMETFLVILQTVLVALITYHLYKQNINLEEEYQIEQVSPSRQIPKIILLIVIVISSLGIIMSGDVITTYIKESTKIEAYRWHGEKKNEIIIDLISHTYPERMSFSSTIGGFISDFELEADKTRIITPYIWLNDEDFANSTYFSLEVFIGDESIVSFDPVKINKSLDDTENTYYGNHSKINFYSGIDPTYDLSEFSTKLYRFKENIKMDVTLYNDSMDIINSYDLKMNLRDKQNSFSYVDDSIVIKDLEIDNNFVVQTPEIEIEDNCTSIFFVISGSKELKKDDDFIVLTFDYVSEWMDGKQIITSQNAFTYQYIPKQKEYYLHIIGSKGIDSNSSNLINQAWEIDGVSYYIIKTLRLEL